MISIINRPVLSCLALFFLSIANGQNLTPQELNQIHKNPDFINVTNTLIDKGFKFRINERDEKTKELTSVWYFQPFINSGEEVSSYLIKSIDSNQKIKTVFFLYNPFHYKDFLNRLKKAKYKFHGPQIIDNKCYSVFKHRKFLLLTTERQNSNKESYFEVMLMTEW